MSSAAPAAPSAARDVRIREIPHGASMKPFIDLSWKINAGDPHWVPPLRMALEPVLDRKKHPFHQHADVAYFLAERGDEVIGRVAACVNHQYNQFHDDRTGFFGFFECIDDAGVAAALLDAAAEWLRARGRDLMRGPMNFSTNDEFSSPGVLIDGFDTPPAVMMSHNPRYYGGLMDAAGMEKTKDLVAYWIGPDIPERLRNAMERLSQRAGVTIRSVRMKELKSEVARVQEVYNAAWSQNWGFVPMTEAEFNHMASEMKPVVDPDLVLLAEKADGEPIGFLLALPDLNRAFKHLPDGKLFPFGVFKFLWQKRKIRTARLLTLGLKPGYQHLGLGAAMYTRLLQIGVGKGYTGAEGSWILEDNHEMCTALEKLGADKYKRYRVYDRVL
ncbi:GNAT family N-acetyltransferase [Longimicrobium sp.]|uniref:GNAT family N-acetyltransferase n=1 Tax=Longimicrobium sp. TaxID=2029185 RepID=UPI003B3A1BF9